MSNIISSEVQLKEALGISTWRNLSKEKLFNFISTLPNVDSELAIKVIEQLPEFAKMATEMVTILKNVCDKVLEEDARITDKSIEAYKTVISEIYKPLLDELSIIIKRDDLTAEDRKYFADKMIEIANKTEEVADKIGLKDTESKEFKLKVLDTVNNTIGGILAGTLTIGAIILGSKYINKNGFKFLK